MLPHDLAFLCLFFAILPFIYALQVLTGIPEAALVGYLPLVVALMVKGIKWQTTQDGFLRHWLSALVFFVIAHNLVSGLGVLLSGNVAIAGRVLCLYVLPVGVFILASKYNDNQQWKLVKVVAITATVVALEILYENVYVVPIWGDSASASHHKPQGAIQVADPIGKSLHRARRNATYH